MKKLFLIWILSVFCLNLLGCSSKSDKDSIIPPLTDDILLDLAAQALPCDEWKAFANFAILWTWVSRSWNLMYYWVDEVMWFIPTENWDGLKNTCYKIAPLAMEIHQSDKWFSLVSVQAVEDYDGDFLIEDYNPEFDWWKLDEYVKSIFSPAAFAVWQERDYWEHFPDYNDVNRKSFEDKAMEYFNIEPSQVEDFVSYYDNWTIKEVWVYVNEMKDGTWITYDEEWNVIDTQYYINWKLVEEFWPTHYKIIWPNEWFEKETEEWTLVLRWNYEDHTDYIFLTEWMREDYLNSANYWEEVIFKWKAYSVDWAAWSHYYNAESIEQLEAVSEK